MRKLQRLAAASASALLLLGVPLMAQSEPVTIRWFVGLGTGINPDQIPPQQAIAQEFNDTHDNIELEVTFVETSASIDTLSTLIAAGDAPDLVGPVGVGGSNAFADAWLDIQPLVDAAGFDLTQFDEQAVNFYRVEGQGLVGLPFGVFPSFISYNKDLFDEAGLAYPPENYGDMYVMPDGTEAEWNMDTLVAISRILTVDANGNDSSMDEFDPASVEQYGFSGMFNDPRGQAALFGAGSVVGENGEAVIPDIWRTAWKWHHEGMFGEQPFIAPDPVIRTDSWGTGNPFSVGRVAMSYTHLWYVTCCLGTEIANWGIAPVPSYEGNITAKLHADNFRILNTTQHPEEAFEVLLYLTQDRGAELLQVYGGMPARRADQPAFFETLAPNYPADINWQVAIDGLSYADIPSHEGNMPNFAESDARIKTFGTLYQSDATIDMDVEIDRLQADLQVIFDSAAAQ